MSYDAARVIDALPADMRVTLTAASGDSAIAGRASIAEQTLATMYGDDDQYEGSFWFDVSQFATPPAKRERVTVDGQEYYVLAVRVFPGNLRRLDVGGKYGR